MTVVTLLRCCVCRVNWPPIPDCLACPSCKSQTRLMEVEEIGDAPIAVATFDDFCAARDARLDQAA